MRNQKGQQKAGLYTKPPFKGGCLFLLRPRGMTGWRCLTVPVCAWEQLNLKAYMEELFSIAPSKIPDDSDRASHDNTKEEGNAF